MEDQLPCPTHPIRGGDAATALGALGAEISAIKRKEIAISGAYLLVIQIEKYIVSI